MNRRRLFLLLIVTCMGCEKPGPTATPTPAKPVDHGIVVSKETTRIEAPLREDGRIDYLEAINCRFREGVTPDNNAAVPLYRTIGLHALDEPMRSEFFRRLGIDPPSETDARFLTIDEYALDLFGDDAESLVAFHESCSEQFSTSAAQAWSADDRRELAGWLEANEAALAVIARGLDRPGYYMPAVATPEERFRMSGALLPGTQAARDVGRAFAARAMLHLGVGRLDEARTDLFLAHRLARHVGSGATMIETLVAIAIDRAATDGDTALAQSGKLSAADARAFAAELVALPRLTDIVGRIDNFERCMFLDSVLTLAYEGVECIDELDGGEGPSLGKMIRETIGDAPINWNVPLTVGNQWYDRMVEMGRKTPYATRAAAFEDFQAKYSENSKKSAASLPEMSRLRRIGDPGGDKLGGQIAIVLVAALTPALERAVTTEDEQAQRRELAQVALLLAAWRAEHDAYPESLDALAPKYVNELPRDHFTGEALKYRRIDTGYLLYSVGPNHTDDGGVTSEQMGDGDVVVKTP